jgi:hypothetical protein
VVPLTTAPWGEDDQLLAELRAALQQSGAPTPAMAAAGEAAYSWRSIDAELAVLSEESEATGSALVRSATTGTRTLEFQAAHLSVEVEETETGLVGQLVPPTPGEITLWGPGGELGRASADELGCFTLDHPAGDLVRIHCRTPSGALITDWFRC